MRVFLSHSSRDAEIAEALKTLFRTVLGDRVGVAYSSDQAPGQGIAPGKDWRAWIRGELNNTDRTYVLLTPNSMGRPWILWESGVAAGVTLGRSIQGDGGDDDEHAPAVVPLIFGIKPEEVPTPLQDLHAVRGDTAGDNGVHRLLQGLNETLVQPLPDAELEAGSRAAIPGYLDLVTRELTDKQPLEAVLASVGPSFPAKKLEGYWATSYSFRSGKSVRYHADIARVRAESDRYLVATNRTPAPRTEGRKEPFRNDLDLQLVNRHLLGQWKNADDTRYFGMIHLAVKAGEDSMSGHYTSLVNDVESTARPWHWVRIDPATFDGRDTPSRRLADPRKLFTRIQKHDRRAGPIPLDELLENA